MASSDPRCVAGAVVGSLAHDEGDRRSDLDLMFAVADDVPVTEVLEAWSRTIVREFGPVHCSTFPVARSSIACCSSLAACQHLRSRPPLRVFQVDAIRVDPP